VVVRVIAAVRLRRHVVQRRGPVVVIREGPVDRLLAEPTHPAVSRVDRVSHGGRYPSRPRVALGGAVPPVRGPTPTQAGAVAVGRTEQATNERRVTLGAPASHPCARGWRWRRWGHLVRQGYAQDRAD